MTIKLRMRRAPYGRCSLLAAAALGLFAQGVLAFGTGSAASEETCTFSTQLQSSVEVKRLYLVKLEEATAIGMGSSGDAQEIDSFSVNCLSCHDGVAASAVTLKVRNSPSERNSSLDSFTIDHPIGMDYNSYVGAGRGYKPISGNNNITFINGKVGCLSCHAPLNPEKGHLVMSDRNSALCMTCHDK